MCSDPGTLITKRATVSERQGKFLIINRYILLGGIPMKKSSMGLLSVLFTIIISTMVFGFAIPATADEPVNQQGLVDNLNQAKALIIVPSLLKAGFVFGGSGGSGVLIVKDHKTGQWSQPAFYTLGSGSFGLQIGAESAEVIMMVRKQKALDRLFTSSFKLGGDTSIAVGPVGGGAKSNIVADIVSFTRAKGAYAGVSLEGSVIKTRDKWNEAYYGKAVSPIDIIVKGSVSNPGSEALRASVAKAAAGK
jgi:lipid-binding SYLF domain-containing protein